VVKAAPWGTIKKTFRIVYLKGGYVMSADYEMNFKRICVKLEEDTTIKGKINVTNYPRVSDMLKHSTDPFITIISDDQADTAKKVYVIHKKYIVWAELED
jgi:hypothetical protein